MDSRTLFIQLRTILADLYLTPADAQRIASDAGLDLTQIAFDAKAVNNWHNILAVAIELEQLGELLDKALIEYARNQPLLDVYEVYRSFVADGGRLVAPSTRAADSLVVSDPPMMALAPPDDYIQRATEYNQLINYLLAGNGQPVGITASLRGAGGFGKTTLAQAICHDTRIRDAFPDGILWATIGDDRVNVLLGLRKLYQALTGKEARFVDQQDGATQLSALLGNLRCLIVIDDVWNAAHLQPFLEGGAHCARLVTTRMASVIPEENHTVIVDAMRMDEATKLLSWGLDIEDSDTDVLKELAQRLGEWPLLLQIVNRRLQLDVKRRGSSLPTAIASANKRLSVRGLTAFDARRFDVRDPDARKQAVAATIGYSLEGLERDAAYGNTEIDEVARFRELAVFPEDVEVPVITVALLWGQTAGLLDIDTEELCERLDELSLILRYNKQTQTIQLHDVMRQYLIDQSTPVQVVTWHVALLDGYRTQCDDVWWQLPDDGYVYQNLPYHLHAAGQQDALERLMLTYAWLDTKLQATDIVSLIRDLDLRRDKSRHSQLGLLQHALQMSVSALVRDKNQLVSQLYGRLRGLGAQWELYADNAAKQQRSRWLQPQTAMLTPPGGNLLYTLSGHTTGVSNLLLTPDGRLITSCRSLSGIFNTSSDFSVKVWDVREGALLHSLEGHTAGVDKLLLTPDGRLISTGAVGSIGEDHTVKVWDIEQGTLIQSLEGHSDGIWILLLTPDGRLITGSMDGTVKVWNIEHGTLLCSLTAHRESIETLLLTSDGCLISSCTDLSDDSVKVWDIDSGVLLRSLEGHTSRVCSLLLTPDNRLITGSVDRTVRVWDTFNGTVLHIFEDPIVRDNDLLLTPNGRLISVSKDHSVKVWDIEGGTLLHTLEGHTESVFTPLFTPDGRLITHSMDHTVKVWDIETGTLIRSLEGHNEGVSNLLLTSDGRLISGSLDHTAKVWDIVSGTLLHSLEGHNEGVSNLLLTPSGRLVTYCSGDHGDIKILEGKDTTIKVWDIEHGLFKK